MTAAATSFYVTGGTLRPDAPSYVERRADRDLYEGLSRGEFCYVLHARQMGKSSLMARTAARLRQEGVAVVVLDLTAIGQNVTVEQWYDGLLVQLGEALDLEDDLDDYWREHSRLGPLQRWMAALCDVVLARVPGRVTIFLDEIDVVQSLPFSTDEFFAGIRECYNRRAEDPAFERLAFCLLGVASPSDLIRDTRLTPFNIGRRIELTDFTEAEAAPLAAGLLGKGSLTTETRRHGEAHGEQPIEAAEHLLERILYWTGGHPYLTQRLCQAVVVSGNVATYSAVDELCEERFFSPRARERDDNLLFVRERLLRSDADLASLLDLYRKIRQGKRVPDDETNPLVSLLRLSGVVRSAAGRLRVRNRIYERVFDGAWVAASMPDAEVRRQRAAYRRGLARTGTVAGFVILGISAVALSASRLAEERRKTLVESRRLLYSAQMNLAHSAWEDANLVRAMELLEAHRPESGEEDLRGFEWRYLWRLCQGDSQLSVRGRESPVNAVRFSRDGRFLVSGSEDGTVTLRDVATAREFGSFQVSPAGVRTIALSPDGKLLATGSRDGVVRLWDLVSRKLKVALRGHTSWVADVAFSPDGRLLASAAADRSARVWDLHTKQLRDTLLGHRGNVLCVAFSPDGRTLASGSRDTSIRLWDLSRHRLLASLTGHNARVSAIAFSPDGKILVSASRDSSIQLWDVASRRGLGALGRHRDAVWALAFSSDGRRIATCGEDRTVKLWEIAGRRQESLLRGHLAPIYSLAFSPDGNSLATGGADGTISLWDVTPGRHPGILVGHQSWVGCVAFSPDGKRVASGSIDCTNKLWDVASETLVATLGGRTTWANGVAFSPDGKLLAVGSGQWDRPSGPGDVRLWDVAGRRWVATLPIPHASVQALAISPDGELLAAACLDGVARVWEMGSRTLIHSFRDPKGLLANVRFSPDGATLASIGGTITLWDLTRKRRPITLPGEPGGGGGVAFSPDGRTLASSGKHGVIQLWDVAARDAFATMSGHSGATNDLVYSPDGSTLASSSTDGTIKLWNLTTKQEVATLKSHDASVEELAFSPDGNILASASGDGTVRLWRAAAPAETNRPFVLPRRTTAPGTDRLSE